MPGSPVSTWGIIPADAGSTEWYRQDGTGNVDHPRGCGEHPSIASLTACSRGSSPRMRGAPMWTSNRQPG